MEMTLFNCCIVFISLDNLVYLTIYPLWNFDPFQLY